MMRSFRYACFLAIFALCGPAVLAGAADLLAPTEAGRIGMVEAWRRQLSVIGGSQSLVDVELHVEGERSRTFVDVTTGSDDERQVLLRIDSEKVDRFGNPIGIDEAMRQARMEVLRLRNRGVEATISESSAPQVRLYTLGADGTVEARDAESGELFWVVRHGNPRLPSGSLGVNDRFITFTNGSKVLQLSTDDGRLVREFAMSGSPLAGTAIVGEYSLVPTTRAGMEGFPLVNPDLYPFLEFTAGRANAEPAAARGSTIAAWGTDAGFVYVMDTFGEPSSQFRFDCDGEVQSEVAAASEDRFFFGTDRGQTYAIKATRTGQFLWRKGLDEPIIDAAFLDGDRIYFSTIYNHLFCLDVATGEEKWGRPSSRVKSVLASTDEQIFVRTNTFQLGILSKSTGAKMSTVATTIGEQYVTNRHTDRLYLLSDGGTLQCLRPAGSEMPVIKTTIKPPSESEESAGDPRAETPDEAGTPTIDPSEDADPFETDDPFGGDNPDDIFGGGADPF